jgi:hypothetical protein
MQHSTDGWSLEVVITKILAVKTCVFFRITGNWDNFMDAVYQNISAVARHVWATVFGEVHP